MKVLSEGREVTLLRKLSSASQSLMRRSSISGKLWFFSGLRNMINLQLLARSCTFRQTNPPVGKRRGGGNLTISARLPGRGPISHVAEDFLDNQAEFRFRFRRHAHDFRHVDGLEVIGIAGVGD